MPELGVIRKVTQAQARGETPLHVLGEILRLSTEVAGGIRARLIVSAEQMKALFPDEENPPSTFELDESSELITDGPWSRELREGCEASKTSLTADKSLLVVPQVARGLVVVQPGTSTPLDPNRIATLEILADMATGVLTTASALEIERRRTTALEKSRRQLRRQNALLHELAVIDELTGLHNRRFFDLRLSYEIDRSQRYGHPMSLALFDVDFFKRVNDTYGHSVGDDALRHLAQVAGRAVRKADLLARFGGEEFSLLMPETPREGGLTATERLRSAIAASPLLVDDLELTITVSAGVIGIEPGWNGDAEGLVRASDRALYQAKARGRNCVVAGDVA